MNPILAMILSIAMLVSAALITHKIRNFIGLLIALLLVVLANTIAYKELRLNSAPPEKVT